MRTDVTSQAANKKKSALSLNSRRKKHARSLNGSGISRSSTRNSSAKSGYGTWTKLLATAAALGLSGAAFAYYRRRAKSNNSLSTPVDAAALSADKTSDESSSSISHMDSERETFFNS